MKLSIAGSELNEFYPKVYFDGVDFLVAEDEEDLPAEPEYVLEASEAVEPGVWVGLTRNGTVVLNVLEPDGVNLSVLQYVIDSNPGVSLELTGDSIEIDAGSGESLNFIDFTFSGTVTFNDNMDFSVVNDTDQGEANDNNTEQVTTATATIVNDTTVRIALFTTNEFSGPDAGGLPGNYVVTLGATLLNEFEEATVASFEVTAASIM